MDWSTAITIILGSSVLSAFLNHFVSWHQKRAKRIKQATFIALDLAHFFERYSYACLAVAEEHESAEATDGYAGIYIKSIPAIPGLPEYDYQVFDLGLLDKVFDFPQQVVFAAESLSYAFESLDGEDALRLGYKHCLQLARNSLLLADEIRQRYNLTERSLCFGDYSVRQKINDKVKDTHRIR